MAAASVSAIRFTPWKQSTANPNLAQRAVEMASSALFAGLSWNECLEIASSGRLRSFERDEVLFMQGQSARHLVLIQSGTVKLTQLGSNGNEVILWMAGKGDAVGMLSDSAMAAYTCSARATMACKAIVWDCPTLQTVAAKYPRIRWNLSQILTRMLTELQERFREVATEKVAQRLALTLLRLAKQIGEPANGGMEVSLSRDELAQMTGTTLFSISRLLSKWAESGAVLPRRQAVVVLDTALLSRLAESE